MEESRSPGPSWARAAGLIGPILLWVLGAGTAVLAYLAVTYEWYGWPTWAMTCHPSYVSGCPAPTHVFHILAGTYSYLQVGVLVSGALLGGALMLISARGRGWTKTMAPFAVFAGIAVGWLLRWTLWGGPVIFSDHNVAQRLSILAPFVGLVVGAVACSISHVHSLRIGRATHLSNSRFR